MIVDTDSRLRFANPAVERYFGYTPSELLGERLTTIMPERHREAHRDGLEQYVETGKESPNWSDIEFHGKHKDGTEIPLSISFGESEAITGYDPERIESGDIVWGEDILHPADRERAWEIVQEALDNDEAFECTYRILTKDGTVKWLWERGRVVESGVHDERRLEGFITDVTERMDDDQRP